MFNKKKAKEEVEIDKKKVNDVLTLSKKILNLLYIFIIIIGIYALIKLTKETKIFYKINIKNSCATFYRNNSCLDV